MSKKKSDNPEDVSKVAAYNIKVKNIKKVDDVANSEENGNKSKAMNKIIEKYPMEAKSNGI
jgi:hypothetical protein